MPTVMPPAPPVRPAQRPADASGIPARLADAVAELTAGDAWTAWLDVAARFHTYSATNTILIWRQRPDATLLAGKTAWQRAGRRIRQGEPGIRILAPAMRTVGPDSHPDPVTGRWPHRQRVVTGLRETRVWDVSQTDGRAAPTSGSPQQLLEPDTAGGLWDDLADQTATRGYELRRGSCPNPRDRGWTNFVLRTVTIRPDLPQADATTALAHELGHIVLHNPNATGGPLRPCRGVVEVEASSVAHMVGAAHGLTPRSQPAARSRVIAAADVYQAATRVVTAAHDILDRLGHQPTHIHPNPVAPVSPTGSAAPVGLDHRRGSAPTRPALTAVGP